MADLSGAGSSSVLGARAYTTAQIFWPIHQGDHRTVDRNEHQRTSRVPIGTEEDKMKSKAVWISCILAALFCGCAANARVIMMLEQVGPNVVGTGSGTIDPAGLSFLHNGGSAPGIGP